MQNIVKLPQLCQYVRPILDDCRCDAHEYPHISLEHPSIQHSLSIYPNKHKKKGSNNFTLKVRINNTRWAILGPTPGSASSSCKEQGMSPPCFSRQISETFFK